MSGVYAVSAAEGRLYQGEILSDVIERLTTWVGRTDDRDDFGIQEVVHPYVIVLAQDCDLEQDARARSDDKMEGAQRENALLPSVVLVVASEFEKAKDRFGGSDVRKRAKQNKDERFQYLSGVASDEDAVRVGIPPLVLDFKRFFTYPMAELLKAIERGEARRRSRLATPYAEQLSDRFGYFLQRIGLPRDHHDIGT